MDIGGFIVGGSFLWTPLTFAFLVGLATILVWLAIAPARAGRSVEDRLDDYLDRTDIVEAQIMGQSFSRRAALPMLRQILNVLGRFAPTK